MRSLVFAIVVALVTPHPAVSAPFPTGTFSIAARDSVTGELGVAVQSRAFAVGPAVAWAIAGVGAIATQAATNESFGPRGLALLETGLRADQVVDRLVTHDPGEANRQLGVVDHRGGVAAHTGAACQHWAGHRLGEGYAIQGNILAGEAVVDSMARAFEETGGELARRLLAALVAGQAAGGDRRGVQSAALLVVRSSDRYPEYRTRYVHLDVADHPDPIGELERLFAMHEATDLLRAHLRFADAYEAIGDRAMADLERRRVAETMERVLARADVDAGVLNGVAWFAALANVDLDRALEAASRAARLEPESYEILDTLAEVHFRRGEIEQAITVIKRALALEPDNAYLGRQLERFQQAR